MCNELQRTIFHHEYKHIDRQTTTKSNPLFSVSLLTNKKNKQTTNQKTWSFLRISSFPPINICRIVIDLSQTKETLIICSPFSNFYITWDIETK